MPGLCPEVGGAWKVLEVWGFDAPSEHPKSRLGVGMGWVTCSRGAALGCSWGETSPEGQGGGGGKEQNSDFYFCFLNKYLKDLKNIF